MQPAVGPDFRVVQAELALAILEAPFDPPAGEGDAQKLLCLHTVIRGREEVLDLAGADISRNKQLLALAGARLGLLIESHLPTLPDFGALLGFMRPKAFLAPAAQATIRSSHFIQPTGIS